jgi:hypothetical protein
MALCRQQLCWDFVAHGDRAATGRRPSIARTDVQLRDVLDAKWRRCFLDVHLIRLTGEWLATARPVDRTGTGG